MPREEDAMRGKMLTCMLPSERKSSNIPVLPIFQIGV